MFRNIRDPMGTDGFERDGGSRFELAATFEEPQDAAFHGEYGFLDEIDQMFWS
jgi:hypothetical protein